MRINSTESGETTVLQQDYEWILLKRILYFTKGINQLNAVTAKTFLKWLTIFMIMTEIFIQIKIVIKKVMQSCNYNGTTSCPSHQSIFINCTTISFDNFIILLVSMIQSDVGKVMVCLIDCVKCPVLNADKIASFLFFFCKN